MRGRVWLRLPCALLAILAALGNARAQGRLLTDAVWSPRSIWVAAATAALVISCVIAVLRARDREHRRREMQLADAVRDRTLELEAERTRDRESNTILEMIASNQPLGSVLDAIGSLACGGSGGHMCCLMLRRETGEVLLASARGLSRSSQIAIGDPGVIPFEAWRKPEIEGRSSEPLWQRMAQAVGDAQIECIVSRLIGSPAAPLGLLLILGQDAQCSFPQERLGAAVRLARIAIEHSTMYENLHRQARHDPLTGLPNRFRLEECLHTGIHETHAGGQKLALIYIDLDRFKEINDTLSHRAGDLYLRTVAERMKRAVRKEDTVGRIGGDEFNVILPLIPDRSTAEEIAARILEEIRRPLLVDGIDIQSSASLGIAIYPDDATDADELQRRADAAMYSAKAAGKDQCHLYADCSVAVSESSTSIPMDQEIRAAIAEKRLCVDYQPKVTATGRICGLEALLRIEHAIYGEIALSKFFTTAEETGLIVPLGAWVLDEVCRQIADWTRRRISVVPVAVNVSAAQLRRDDFAASVERILTIHGIEPPLIEVEVAESLVTAGGEVTKRQLERLRRLGIRLSLDEFGAGYSSLGYLHRLNVDAIKIDRSFVQSLERNAPAQRVVEAIIGAAGGMGLDVIADGVETEGQRAALVQAGCAVMQGYFFARPQPGAAIEQMLLPAASPAAPATGAATGEFAAA